MAERWRGRVALVTGASAGIGYSVAKVLVERGMKVVACARNIAAIEVTSVTGTVGVRFLPHFVYQTTHVIDKDAHLTRSIHPLRYIIIIIVFSPSSAGKLSSVSLSAPV